MYGRKFSGIGEGAPLVCDVCGNRVYKIRRTYKDGIPYWVCDKCPRQEGVMNKNKKLLDDFKKYCDQNPSQRLWQALSNWSGLQFIYAGKYPTDLEDTLSSLV